MKVRWITTTMLALAVGFAPAITFAQTTAPSEKRSEKRAERAGDKSAADKSALPASDRKFVQDAMKGNLAEVELGKLASEKAANEQVKQFGQRMVEDHGKAAEELKEIAQDKGITAPSELDPKHKKLHDRLSKLSGEAFDRAYVTEMVKDHRKEVSEFKREAQKAKDPAVKEYASKTLPTLQEHLKQVESLQNEVKRTAQATEKKGAEKKPTERKATERKGAEKQ